MIWMERRAKRYARRHPGIQKGEWLRVAFGMPTDLAVLIKMAYDIQRKEASEQR